MKLFCVYCLLLFLVQEVPFKAKEEFDIKLNYQFKQRPSADHRNTVNLDESRKDYERRTSSDQLPYLILNVKFLKITPEEVRVRITNNRNNRSLTKKLSEGLVIPIDVGFTDDVKDRINAHEYVLTLLSPQKSETSKIVIHIEEDGSFLVNGEKRGKF